MKKAVLIVSILFLSPQLMAETYKYEGRYVLQAPYQGSYTLRTTLDLKQKGEFANVPYTAKITTRDEQEYDDIIKVQSCTKTWVVPVGTSKVEVLNSKNEIVSVSNQDVNVAISTSSKDLDVCKQVAPADELINAPYAYNVSSAASINDKISDHPTRVDLKFSIAARSEAVFYYDTETKTMQLSTINDLVPTVIPVNWIIYSSDTNSQYMPDQGAAQMEAVLWGSGNLLAK